MDVLEYVKAKVSSPPVAKTFSLTYVLQEQDEADAVETRNSDKKAIKHICTTFQAWPAEIDIKSLINALSFVKPLGRIPGWQKVDLAQPLDL